VILDIGLPDLNGWDVCRAPRAAPKGEHRTIIALTGWGDVRDREHSASAGFDHHCAKPVDAARLRELLAASLGKPA